ncbi:hypothetical protein CPB86DRAFT_798152 [Serendipita vermifera]|nr:hypothetical protein CPB86DRAFT_798152 [Serendipita vermifera]
MCEQTKSRSGLRLENPSKLGLTITELCHPTSHSLRSPRESLHTKHGYDKQRCFQDDDSGNKDPTRSNTITNNHALSLFMSKLYTTPVAIHDALVFKFAQEQEFMKRVRGSEAVQSFHRPAPPPTSNSSPADMTRLVAQFWMCLDASEKSQWAELARDIRNAYTQLVAAFGDGVIFDANTWEEERKYRTKSIFLKWLGAQVVQRGWETSNLFIPVTSGEFGQTNTPYPSIEPTFWNSPSYTYQDPSAAQGQYAPAI